MRISSKDARERALLNMHNCMRYIKQNNERMAHTAYGAATEWADLYYDMTDNFLMDDNDEFYEMVYKYEKTYFPHLQ